MKVLNMKLLAALVAGSLFVCDAAVAAPLVNTRLVVNGGPNDGASTLEVGLGDTVNFRVEARLAPIGTTNNYAANPLTIESLDPAVDGLSSNRFNVYQELTDVIQIDFDSVLVRDSDFRGFRSSDGTLSPRGNTFDDVVRVNANATPRGLGIGGFETLVTGSFTVDVAAPDTSAVVRLSSVRPTSAGMTSFVINGGSVIGTDVDSESSRDPYIGYQSLTLTTAVPEPASLALLAAGVGSLLLRRRRQLV